MGTKTIPEERKFRLTSEERSSWEKNGYFVRYDVFTEAENDLLAQIADDITIGKRAFPDYHIFQNALANGTVHTRCVSAFLDDTPRRMRREPIRLDMVPTADGSEEGTARDVCLFVILG
ncbi:MAG: hypothetical protein OXI61_00225 [Candidatus Poribacteria bacterium]|nr:hypothetical protein [Candidatus Poribacteria bacterium]